jgi:hypothetical protein
LLQKWYRLDVEVLNTHMQQLHVATSAAAAPPAKSSSSSSSSSSSTPAAVGGDDLGNTKNSSHTAPSPMSDFDKLKADRQAEEVESAKIDMFTEQLEQLLEQLDNQPQSPSQQPPPPPSSNKQSPKKRKPKSPNKVKSPTSSASSSSPDASLAPSTSSSSAKTIQGTNTHIHFFDFGFSI